MRTFIAIDLDPKIKKALADFVNELRKAGAGNISWTQEKGMHLTLKFLGEIDEAQVAPITEFLKTVTARHGRFQISVQGTGYFPPNPKYLRVIWAGIEDQPALSALEREIEAGLEKLEFPREKRDFHPHLTLGRVRFPANLNPILAELEHSRQRRFGDMRVDKITFFQSLLKPTGAEYMVLSESSLG